MSVLKRINYNKMIGFLAKRQRGKDTACDYLVENYGYTKRAFAYPLKKGVQEWFGFSDEQLFTEKKEEEDKNWGVSPRHVCQVVGSEVVRDMFPKILLPHIGNDFWVRRGDIWYENNKDSHQGKVVWSDVRFQNEVDYILSKGGIIVKIDRPELDEKESEKTDSHQSELCIDKINNYSGKILNVGTLDDFYEDIDWLMSIDRKLLNGGINIYRRI